MTQSCLKKQLTNDLNKYNQVIIIIWNLVVEVTLRETKPTCCLTWESDKRGVGRNQA